MTLQSKLMQIGNKLASLDIENVHHYRRTGLDAPYLVWQEDGEEGSFHSNNQKDIQKITGTIDYFTKEEFDSNIDSIQEALNEIVPWRLESVQYEEETELIHYEWSFEVI